MKLIVSPSVYWRSNMVQGTEHSVSTELFSFIQYIYFDNFVHGVYYLHFIIGK